MRLALLLCCLLAIPSSGAAQENVFRSQVQLVTVLATVRDTRGALTGSLTRDDFIVLDDGRPQEIRVFEKQSVPLAIALLVDASGSTAKDLKFELDSAARFVRNILRPQDRLGLFAFTQSVEQIGSFTSDPASVERGLKDIRSSGGTSLYDAIFLASEQLHSREGRRVIVLVTDGDDTTSIANYQQALRAAQEADVAIYAVTVVPILSSAGRNIGGEHVLITLSNDTGGRAYAPRAAVDLEPVFKDLAEELRTQYILGFYAQSQGLTRAQLERQPKATRGYRHLEVKSKNPGFTVQARKGYYFKEDLQ